MTVFMVEQRNMRGYGCYAVAEDVHFFGSSLEKCEEWLRNESHDFAAEGTYWWAILECKVDDPGPHNVQLIKTFSHDLKEITEQPVWTLPPSPHGHWPKEKAFMETYDDEDG